MSDPVQKAAVLDRILAHVPAGVVHVSPTGQILLANDRACRFLGLSHDEVTDRYTTNWSGATFHEDGRPCPVEEYPVTRCLTTGQAQPETTIGVEQPNGEVRWAVFTALPVPEQGAVVTLVDITDRMQRERERSAMQAQLQRQDRLASMGQLAAGVAHEINNPLTYVLGYVARAQTLVDPSTEAGECIAEVREGAERVARIVRDLSRFSRVHEREPEAFDASEAVHTALALSRAEFRHRAHLELDLRPTPKVWGHPDRLVQVLVNLLVNAAHAIEPGNLDDHRVTVTLDHREDQVTIAVTDTGIGMDEGTLARALDPFFTTKPLGRGTGLGLSISHEILMSMGGTLQLSSIQGQGTVATCMLAVAATEATPTTSTDKAPRHSGKKRLLIVDDERAIRDLLTWMLSDHEIQTASAGDEALARILDEDFDLVLCDLLMPRMTGMELYRRVEQERPDLLPRLVFMTAGAFTPDASAFVEAGLSRILTKPFDQRALLDLLDEVQGEANRTRSGS